jgi:serine/threonine protein kinase
MGYSTDLTLRGVTSELAALKQLASSLTSTHCIQLLSHFIHPGKDHRDGDHLCLVTEILGGNVKFLQKSVNKAFPLPLAKLILLHTLRGIAHMHSCEIVHTDLKHDNIMFDASSLTSDDFAALIEADLPRRHHSPEDGTFQAAVSQPLPLPSLSEAMTRTYLVADFGSGKLFFFAFLYNSRG